MGFVREDLTKEQGEELQKKYNIVRPNPGHEPVIAGRIVADQERDAIFVGLEHGRQWFMYNQQKSIDPSRFLLVWKGDKIRLDYYLRAVSDVEDISSDTSYQTSAIVTHIWAPVALQDKRDEILTIAREAVEADAKLWHIKNYQGVVIPEDEPLFVEPMENYL